MGNENEKEILREQLRLLAERSKDCDGKHLADITLSMVAIYSALLSSDFNVLQ